MVAERRRQILEAACAVVAEHGFRSLRISDVADRAGFSTGTVHYYFGNKDELLKQAFRFQFEESVRRRGADDTGDDDPVARLLRLAENYLPISQPTVDAWRVWMELWVSALGDVGMRKVNNHYYDDWRGAVLQAVTEGTGRGLLAVSDPVVFTDVFVSMLDGLAIQVVIGSEHMDAQRMRATCRAFIDVAVVRDRDRTAARTLPSSAGS